MPGLTCNACNKELKDEADQKLHYRSEWHRYNLKRKVAGVPGVTEALFLARQAALSEDKTNSNQTPMHYSCAICNKGYRSDKALAQHLGSRAHVLRTSQGTSPQHEETTIKPLQKRVPVKTLIKNRVDSLESEDEWEEVGSDEELIGEAMDSLAEMNVNDPSSTHENMEEDDDDDEEEHFELDPSCCFMCDREHANIEQCMVHMHKQHGFFIPDIEYLKDPQGLLTYLGLKVKRDFICLYCNERCHPFSSLEAVRKHMEAKGHCKVHYGDGDDEEEAELEEFYDYSSSYGDVAGKQLVAIGDMVEKAEFAGSELIITRRSDDGLSTKTLGSREFLRYYHQKPRPSPANSVAITAALTSRYRSMGLATVQSRQNMVRMKVLKEMNRSGVEVMRSKLGMKNNIIRNLPKNVPH